MATLSGFFGGLAVALAVVGLYGVVSYTTARRRNEIGIRVALGAARIAVIRMILRDSALMLLPGLAIGAALSLWATQGARKLLFGIELQFRNDPLAELQERAGGTGGLRRHNFLARLR